MKRKIFNCVFLISVLFLGLCNKVNAQELALTSFSEKECVYGNTSLDADGISIAFKNKSNRISESCSGNGSTCSVRLATGDVSKFYQNENFICPPKIDLALDNGLGYVIEYMATVPANQESNIDEPQELDSYGIYCAYKDGFYFSYKGYSKEDTFEFETNFDTYGTGIAIEYGRPGKRLDNTEEQEWLKSKGLIDNNGNFSCPTNPFGSDLGEPIDKLCGPANCQIIEVETAYKSYTCNYTGQTTGSNLNISHICEGENCHWEIKYPDGTTETPPYNTFLPTETCDDIYFTYTDKKIHQIFKDNWGTDLTLNDVCKDNGQSDIEYFCSSNCDYKEIICPIVEGCEGIFGEELLGIIQEVLNYIQIAAPILLIVFGVVDFGQAILSDDQNALKKATSKFTKRAIACIAIFFAPLIVNLLLNLIEGMTTDPTCGIK